MGLCCPRRCVRSMACISAALSDEIAKVKVRGRRRGRGRWRGRWRGRVRVSFRLSYLCVPVTRRAGCLPNLPVCLQIASVGEPLIHYLSHCILTHCLSYYNSSSSSGGSSINIVIIIPGFHQGSMMKMCDATVRLRATPPAFREINSTWHKGMYEDMKGGLVLQ